MPTVIQPARARALPFNPLCYRARQAGSNQCRQ
jgi:hypothetical protein